MKPPEDLRDRQPMPPFDLTGLQTFALAERPSKVFHEDLGRPNGANQEVRGFVRSLPNQLAASAFRRLVGHLVRAHRQQKLVVAALGGHVVKTGCTPFLIDLMRRGVLKAFALNGAAAIHDLELALCGRTSEDVGPRLVDGTFGMAKDTADVYAHAASLAAESGCGLGRALGGHLSRLDCRHPETSLLVQAYRWNVPLTVHVGMGTDVVHMHPQLSGAALGDATMTDFRILTTAVSRLAGGVWLNFGCAVLMPEVFLKAVSIVRNFGHSLDGLVTANFDMIQQYRGRVNVCERPGDEGIGITGHHEIMIPLLQATVAAELDAIDRTPVAHHQPEAVLAGES